MQENSFLAQNSFPKAPQKKLQKVKYFKDKF